MTQEEEEEEEEEEAFLAFLPLAFSLRLQRERFIFYIISRIHTCTQVDLERERERERQIFCQTKVGRVWVMNEAEHMMRAIFNPQQRCVWESGKERGRSEKSTQISLSNPYGFTNVEKLN